MDGSKKIKFNIKKISDEQVAPECSGGGNTNSPPPHDKKALGNQCLYWCFTFNNYTESQVLQVRDRLEECSEMFVFQKEKGENGTLHLQGCLKAKKKMRWSEFKLPKEIHWEKMKGSWKDNIAYCSKESDDGRIADTDLYSKGIVWPKPLKLIDPKDFYPWQSEVVEIIENEPDDRAIWWFHEPNGAVGKTSLVKYLCAKYRALIVSGKGGDMKYLIVKYHEKHGVYPELILFNVPRTAKDYISWTGMEEVKDGVFASTKYECDTVVMNCPHLCVFANFAPDESVMSKDRWHVRVIEDNKLKSEVQRVNQNEEFSFEDYDELDIHPKLGLHKYFDLNVEMD